ncbi:NAD(P)H-hydrate dehydratase [Ferruginibacter lapsinanis]|uniref:NAD(P)H-hydrate dehydratase n=1 Tax=Ferruginibacter lapsinanis TaxID=563172 RepID=UPI001E3FD8D2|nr:NAD(P)H-hydrate dehydratase [Ferruginibacter lapsinanis]UEG50038.1 NAD(P)H-hydrate dehydratase [Ferruginibacter lapsinanis]
MKILSAKQIKEADAYTIAHEPIASIDLMERAAANCFKWIIENTNPGVRFTIFCGTGNNGGDGLAIARMLHQFGCPVTTYIVHSESKASADFLTNETRLKNIDEAICIDITSITELPLISTNDIIIDALFGTGLNKPIKGVAADLIQYINHSRSIVIAIDMPSGLFADQPSGVSSNQIIKATYTLSFQLHKLAFFFAENAPYTGEVIILPIGLNEQFIDSCQSNYELIETTHIQHIIKPRPFFSHKGNYGKAAIIAGSYGKMGAAVLAAKACLRTGCGLLTMIIPKCGYDILQTTVPESMVICDENDTMISSEYSLDTFDTIGIGPGIGTANETVNVFKQILQHYKQPIVIDADAINIIAANKELMDLIPPESIFTPHPKEFERLVGKTNDHFERNKLQIEFSTKHNVFIVLKGRYTCISCPDGSCYFNPTGNPGMAKGGSGDTLTGMLTGLLSQGYSSKDTCITGVYLHGLAADIAVQTTGEYSLLASDMIDHIGQAFKKETGH